LQNQSEVIFVGTVSAADNPPDPTAYRTETGQARYSFRVEESISNVGAKQLDVYSGRGCCDCSIGFQIGAKYLVDAWRGNDGLVHASICSKTRQLTDSDPLLPELRAMRDGKKPDSLFGVVRKVHGAYPDSKNDDPLGGRTIRLDSAEQSYTATTNAQGNYSFSNLPAGEYSVSADLPPNLILGSLLLRTPVPPFKVATNACGEYDLNAFPTGRISGRVVGPDGEAVSGWDAAPLHLFRSDRYKDRGDGWEDEAWRSFPESAGSFVFDHVPPGDYVLVFNYGNFDARSPYSMTFYPTARDVQHATIIHVEDGARVEDIVVRVAKYSSPY
jgi:hypothetical protein